MWLRSIPASARSRSPQARRRAQPALLLEALEDRCVPSAYAFTDIADFGPNSFFSQPIMTGTLNNQGTVTFRAALSSGGQGAFTRDTEGNLGVIALTNDEITALPIGGRINDSGTVSFCANLSDGTQAIFTGDGHGLTRIADTGPDSPFRAILPQAADVTNQGLVAFRATLKSGGTGVFTERAGEPPQLLYVTGGQFSAILNQNIQRNGDLVAVLANLSSGGEGIFLGDGVTTKTIVTTGDAYSSLAAPVANDEGLTAFEANRADGSQAILTGDGADLTTVAATGGRFRDFTGNVSINNDGEVVFAADAASGARGIFSAQGHAVHEIIGVGDPLLGSTVTSLAAVPFSPRALNNLGQFGFLANLADGRTVWVRADPLKAGGEPTPSESAPQLVGEATAWTAPVPPKSVGLVDNLNVGAEGHPAASDEAEQGAPTLARVAAPVLQAGDGQTSTHVPDALFAGLADGQSDAPGDLWSEQSSR